ncbi:MAG: NADP-dependent malic enzyme [Oscillospiraceae bacterium]
MDIKEKALNAHKEWKGKIEIVSRAPINSKEDLAVAYTPGVAEPCLKIAENTDLSFSLTRRGNLVAVITDGTAVLGLGDIGPEAGMPVMEGKCSLFKRFADVDAFPICIDSKDTDEIVKTIKNISKSFGGINLEDISAPRCFEIEERLKKELDIPVFHDDQHGTAIIVASGIINSIRLTNKKDITVVINGAGAADIAIAKLLLKLPCVADVILCDSTGIIYQGRERQNEAKNEIAKITNKTGKKGLLADALAGADAFVGVSGPNLVSKDMVRSMNDKPIIFAIANPIPEIMPDDAKEAGAYIIGTGRSDFPNQINNVLCFPGIFKGALECRAKAITEEMKIAVAYAIAEIIPENELNPEYILPDPFNEKVARAVADAVIKCNNEGK